MKRGDIFMATLDPTKGREQKGYRPILVVSSNEFNALMGIPVIAPIATVGNFARASGFAVPLVTAGTKTTGVVLCDQIRVLDLKARVARYVEGVPGFIMDEVLAKIAPIFEEDV